MPHEGAAYLHTFSLSAEVDAAPTDSASHASAPARERVAHGDGRPSGFVSIHGVGRSGAGHSDLYHLYSLCDIFLAS